jgi:serine/threonine-protein kinase HipA
MTACLICLEIVRDSTAYHASCSEALFGTNVLPTLDYELGELYAVAAQMAGKMSISGIQEKVSLRLSPDKSRLEVAVTGGRYILKPEPARYSDLTLKEHISMLLASLVGIETPPFGLIHLKDGAVSYIIKRFDRLDDGSKLQVEDFCQLAEKPPRDKYEGSAELCVRALRRFATEPVLELSKLYRLLLFGWWIANGDMHLKNFSLLTTPDATRRLSPAYDLVCTRLAIAEDDSLALPMGGKKKGLTRRKWLEFGDYCRLPKRAVEGMIAAQVNALDPSIAIIDRSLLPEKKKGEYGKIIREHTALLAGQSS